MPRVCTLCRHEKRQEIDKALVAAEPLRTIADRWSVSKTALLRHREHIPARLTKAREAREVARADDLLTGIVALRERLEKALQGTQSAKDVASLARELRETLRLMLELEGRLRQGAHVQVAVSLLQSPEWAALQARIALALSPFPEARAAVLAAIEGRDAAPSPSRALVDRTSASTSIVATTAGAGT